MPLHFRHSANYAASLEFGQLSIAHPQQFLENIFIVFPQVGSCLLYTSDAADDS